MGARGRPSSASLAGVGPIEIENIRRPAPPSELTQEQAVEWRAVVNRMSADWFPRETHGMLVQYCRMVTRARRLAQLIGAAEDADPFDVKEYTLLVRSEQELSRVIMSLATKMRISQQATVRHELARKPPQIKEPWERV